MSSRLTRRALFALPVALPVAAVAARVAPARAYATGGALTPAEYFRRLDAATEGEWSTTRRILRMDRAQRLWKDGLLSANDLRKVLRFIDGRSTEPLEERLAVHFDIPPLGEAKSCGGVEGHAAKSWRGEMAAADPSAALAHTYERLGEIGPPRDKLGVDGPEDEPAAGVEPRPQDTPTQPAVA